jgi:hypothetical protein
MRNVHNGLKALNEKSMDLKEPFPKFAYAIDQSLHNTIILFGNKLLIIR